MNSGPEPPPRRKTLRPAQLFGLSTLSMLAFAANSLLTRAALRETPIDPMTFASVRLTSGAAALALVLAVRGQRPRGNWLSALFLLVYAVPFSVSYVSLATGTGALLLFGSVQATMILHGLVTGERPSPPKWLGIAAAVAGLLVLLLPGARAPSPLGAALMAFAGIGWGAYSLRGKGALEPLAETAGNFSRATVIALLLSLLAVACDQGAAVRSLTSPPGVALAIASGAVTSGLGYAIWYAALPHLTSTVAATVQLTVPVLAALLGTLFLAEIPSLRLWGATALILGGVLTLAIASRPSRPPPPSPER